MKKLVFSSLGLFCVASGIDVMQWLQNIMLGQFSQFIF